MIHYFSLNNLFTSEISAYTRITREITPITAQKKSAPGSRGLRSNSSEADSLSSLKDIRAPGKHRRRAVRVPYADELPGHIVDLCVPLAQLRRFPHGTERRRRNGAIAAEAKGDLITGFAHIREHKPRFGAAVPTRRRVQRIGERSEVPRLEERISVASGRPLLLFRIAVLPCRIRMDDAQSEASRRRISFD